MKAVKWYCENCGTTVIPGEEIVWDEESGCPGCGRVAMIREEPKSKKKEKQDDTDSRN
jgi:predicted RNA-binding Zn-ribbon protein involved in translation (DUF1610 family)